MPKDYLQLTKDDRMKLLNVKRAKRQKSQNIITIYTVLIISNIYTILIISKGD